jgi:uncharacterized membrane protein
MQLIKSDKFSIVETLKYAFYETLEHFFFFLGTFITWLISMSFGLTVLGALLLYPIRNSITAFLSHFDKIEKLESTVSIRLKMVMDFFTKEMSLVSVIFFIGAYLLYHFLQYGLIRIAFDIHDKNTSTVSRMFSAWPVLLKGLAVSALYYLMVVGGLMLFIIPGLIAATTFCLALYILIDTNCGIIEAFKESARLTYGSRKHIFGLIFILLTLKHVLMGATGIGYVIFWPIGMLAMVYLYRKLQVKNVTTYA